MLEAAELNKLTSRAQERTRHLNDQRTPATAIYALARRVAYTMPEPLGSALAGVFAMAEYERRLTGLGGVIGENSTTLALAVAVIESGSHAITPPAVYTVPRPE